MENVTEEEKEWLKRIRLAKYKSLSLKEDNDSQKLMKWFEELLLEEGFTKEELQLELERFKREELPDKDEILKNKVGEIMYDIVATLEEKKPEKGYISTSDYPEYYYRIQEVVAMDTELGPELLMEAERRANIEHSDYHNEDLQGNDIGNHTYYFSKKSVK